MLEGQTTEWTDDEAVLRLRFRVVRAFRGYLRMEAWKPLTIEGYRVGEVDGFPRDGQFLEGKGHEPGPI